MTRWLAACAILVTWCVACGGSPTGPLDSMVGMITPDAGQPVAKAEPMPSQTGPTADAGSPDALPTLAQKASAPDGAPVGASEAGSDAAGLATETGGPDAEPDPLQLQAPAIALWSGAPGTVSADYGIRCQLSATLFPHIQVCHDVIQPPTWQLYPSPAHWEVAGQSYDALHAGCVDQGFPPPGLSPSSAKPAMRVQPSAFGPSPQTFFAWCSDPTDGFHDSPLAMLTASF